jgi:hypothetical protein
VDDKSVLYVKLDKALYGCIESALLFYKHLSKALHDLGFNPNPYDPCVFNKEVNGKQCTICVHVDDLKISCEDESAIDAVCDGLRLLYKSINIATGERLDYLGMELDYSVQGEVSISMQSMVEQIVDEYDVGTPSKSPAPVYLFQVSDDSAKLNKQDKEKFHSTVQKLLYLSKRARPDILTAVSFLTSRVMQPTEEDLSKLMRCLRYLKGTSDLKLVLSGSKGMVITSYVDASYAVHPDGKSHTGATISIGGGAVYSKSSKQKLVAKSSTEAELVGLSDALSQVLWTRNFMQTQGYKVGEAVVNQDNKSTIILAEKERSTSSRTRHISIRYFFIKDRIDSKEVSMQYCGTEDMIADFLTKPLQGSLFMKHRRAILNSHVHSSQGHVGDERVSSH